MTLPDPAHSAAATAAADDTLPQFFDCNCLAVRRAGRAMQQLYDQHLAPTGLRGGQYSVLSYLGRLGPVGMNALAQAVGVDRTTLNRSLQPLVRDGLVEVGGSDEDRRAKRLVLTAAGARKQAEGRVCWEAAQAAFETNFGVKESAQLRALLQGVDALARGR